MIGGFEAGTGYRTRMPSRNRFRVPLTLKQFFPFHHLRIFPIQNLEPSAVLSFRDVRAKFLLRYNALSNPIRRLRNLAKKGDHFVLDFGAKGANNGRSEKSLLCAVG